MCLLALQFGLQPILTKRFTPTTINRSTVVLTQDVVKFFMAGSVLVVTGGWTDAVAGEASFCLLGLVPAFVQNHFFFVPHNTCVYHLLFLFLNFFAKEMILFV